MQLTAVQLTVYIENKMSDNCVETEVTNVPRGNSSVVTPQGNAQIFSLLTTVVYHDSFLGCHYLFYKSILGFRS